MNSNDLNNEQLAQFYLERLRTCDRDWEELCRSQRQEIERLQRLCNDLRLQQTMQRANVAEEVSQYCQRLANCAGTNRLGTATTTTQAQTNTKNTSTIIPPANPNRLIPLRAILRFLNRYTNGMVIDHSFQGEKRLRADGAASPILLPASSVSNNNNNNNNTNNSTNNNSSRQQNPVDPLFGQLGLQNRQRNIINNGFAEVSNNNNNSGETNNNASSSGKMLLFDLLQQQKNKALKNGNKVFVDYPEALAMQTALCRRRYKPEIVENNNNDDEYYDDDEEDFDIEDEDDENNNNNNGNDENEQQENDDEQNYNNDNNNGGRGNENDDDYEFYQQQQQQNQNFQPSSCRFQEYQNQNNNNHNFNNNFNNGCNYNNNHNQNFGNNNNNDNNSHSCADD